ncbi:MAG: hypothetical protein NZM18_09570 [Thermoflexales bacterium]|nr:hypothetical protein [Thermoflexales bacterium]MDW8352739.1 hypothetical protein [Anaerolineae bacterium]
MNKLRRIRLAQLLMVALLFIVIGALTFTLRDVVREAVVIPLAYAVWLTDVLLRSLPQSLFLAILLMISAVIVLRRLLQANAQPDELPSRPTVSGTRSRLGFWMRQLNNLDRSRFAREQVAQEMRNLILRTLAQTRQLEPGEVMAGIRSGAIGVPPEVEGLLRNWQGWMETERDDGYGWGWLWQRLRRALRPRAQASSPLDDKLKAAVDYLETQLGNST